MELKEITESFGYGITALIGAGLMWLKGRNQYSALSGQTEALDAMRTVNAELQKSYTQLAERVNAVEAKLVAERIECQREIQELREKLEGLTRDALVQAEMDKAGREGRIERRKKA